MSVFEAAMLICFGAAWPVSIYKSWTSRTTAGKSVVFLFIILIGYGSGMIHKCRTHFDPVFFLYLLNALMVLADIALYFRNKRLAATVVTPPDK
ncbi:MAG: hypothetical protein JW828_15540 [Sedimentisphaerales bacterium]|nr:hypothetical protein [Sedimentisphaerales bacterium]